MRPAGEAGHEKGRGAGDRNPIPGGSPWAVCHWGEQNRHLRRARCFFVVNASLFWGSTVLTMPLTLASL